MSNLPKLDTANTWYILEEDGSVREARSPQEANEFLMSERKRIRVERAGHYVVSTVFLVLDHNWSAHPAPVLFESMVWPIDPQGDILHDSVPPITRGDHLDCVRYHTKAEALEGHAKLVKEWEREPAYDKRRSESSDDYRYTN